LPFPQPPRGAIQPQPPWGRVQPAGAIRLMGICVTGESRRPAREPLPKTRPSRRASMPVSGIEVKLYPEIALAALATKQDRQLRVWALARALDPEGSGRVPLARIAETVEGEGIKGMARTTVLRMARDGDGVWWSFLSDKGRPPLLELRGLEKVAVALAVAHVSAPVIVKMPLKLKDFRALCAFAWSARRGGMMSQAKLEEIITPPGSEPGKVARTLRRYIRALGDTLDVTHNVIETGLAWHRGDNIPDGFTVDYVNGKLELVKWLPNRYQLRVPVGRRGMTKKVNQSLRGGAPEELPGDSRHARLFYHWPDTRSAQKRQMRRITRRYAEATEGDIFMVGQPKPTRGGLRLFRRVEFAQGRFLWRFA